MQVMSISTRSVLKQSKEVAHQQVLNETVVVVPRKATIHLLNPTGTFIWKAARNGVSLRKLVSLLCAEYRVSRKRAERDCLAFVGQLKKKGILVVQQVKS
jgi:predicted nucleic acid-binding protein